MSLHLSGRVARPGDGEPPAPPLPREAAPGIADQLERALRLSIDPADHQLLAAIDRWRCGDLA